MLSVLLVAGSGWGWYLVRVAEASVNRTDAIPTTGNSDINGDGHAGQAMNMLLVGVDSRAGSPRSRSTSTPPATPRTCTTPTR